MEYDLWELLRRLPVLTTPNSLTHTFSVTHSTLKSIVLTLAAPADVGVWLLVLGVVGVGCVVVTWMVLVYRRLSRERREGCRFSGHEGPKEETAAPGEWVRPLSNLGEVISAVGAEFGTFNMAQVLWLSSSRPITSHHVRLALTEVAQKVLVLQLSVAWRRLWPWYRRMRRVIVDFSVSKDDDPMTVYSRELRATYKVSEGPLWRARLVPLSQPCPGHHQAALVLTLHHVITDGTTNMLISRDLLQALNAATAGRCSQIPTRGLVPARSERAATTCDWLPSLTFMLSAVRTALTTAFSSRSLTRHLPRPNPRTALTKVLRKDFSPEVTEKLFQRCKEAGVRVHSCVTAAASLALHRTVQQFSTHKLDAVNIVHEQAVNLRRYYGQKYRESAGSVAFLVVQEHTVHDNREAFWSLARIMQQELDHSLEVRRTPLRSASLSWLCSAIIPINFLLSKLGCISFTYSHINFSNMGNLEHLLPARYPGGPVHLTGLLRSMAGELAGSLCCINCQTLEGRLLLSLDYFTNKITDEVAAALLSHLTRGLQEMAALEAPPVAGNCHNSHTARGCNPDG